MTIVPKQIPLFKDGSTNNPFTTLDQQNVSRMNAEEKERREDKERRNALNNPPTLFEFKINDNVIKYPEGKKMQEDPFKSMISQGIYPNPYVPIPNPFFPTQNPMNPYSYAPNQIPVIKKYNISISNSNGDLEKIHDLYEDVLPQVNGITQKTLTTLSERLIIYQYLRSIFIKHADGEDIQIGGSKTGDRNELVNLLSHIKLMEINPYHFSKITNNPYKTLPDNFLMFRSCYPVRLNMQNNVVQCAVDNIGVNIRIYQMRICDILANKIGYRLTKKDSDVWREISYYEYIREHILKTKISPNFIMLYAWYVSLKSGVDFIKLKRLKNEKSNNSTNIQENVDILNLKLKEDLASTLIEYNNINTPQGLSIFKKNGSAQLKNISESMLFQGSDFDKLETYPTNKCTVMITEAPNNNLYDWSTRSYSVELGPVKRMVQTGFHDIKIWQSIVFQLLISMYILKIHKIAINEFSIENNVYIKSLTKDENNIGYWKFKVEGIDFYIPNYGYLLLIDSKFQEIKDGIENVSLDRSKKLVFKHKILAKMFDDSDKEVDDMNKQNILNVFNSNNFSQGFTQSGGNKPPAEILKMINDINALLSDDRNTFVDVLLLTQAHFLHNRLGSLTKEIEFEQIVQNTFNFKTGDIIAHKLPGSNDKAYNWALYIKKNEPNGHEIFTINPNNILDYNSIKLIKQNVADGSIFRSYGAIEQNYKPNQKISEEDILETYIINSN
jgi:hypothetical protein